MFLPYYGDLIALVIFTLNIWAIINVVQSGADVAAKIIWTIVILALPLLGLLLWYFAGPGKKTM